jgi:polyisoprenoid-binding protein YceI
MIRRIEFLILAGLCAISLASSARAEKFYVAGAPESDSVVFESDAKLEFIEGTTNVISGVIDFDPTKPQLPCGGHLRVDARTLKTGIEMRDEHMRERHLQTDQFPFIEFVLKSVEGLPAQLESGSAQKFQLAGDFTVHGTTKAITAPGTVEMVATGGFDKPQAMIVTATFNIKLDDYGVPRPKMLLLKLAETIRIRVRFVASTGNPVVTF